MSAILAAKADTPFAADYLKKLLNRLMKYARKIRMRGDNPIADVDSYNAKFGGFHTWTATNSLGSRHGTLSAARRGSPTLSSGTPVSAALTWW